MSPAVTRTGSGLAVEVGRVADLIRALGASPHRLPEVTAEVAALETMASRRGRVLVAGAAMALRDKLEFWAGRSGSAAVLSALAAAWERHGTELVTALSDDEVDQAWQALQPHLAPAAEVATAGLGSAAGDDAIAWRFLADVEAPVPMAEATIDERWTRMADPGWAGPVSDELAALEAEMFLAGIAGVSTPPRPRAMPRATPREPGPVAAPATKPVTPPEPVAAAADVVPPEIEHAFEQEAADALAEMGESIDRWARAPAEEAAALRNVFRLAHSVKGAANSVGRAACGRVLHRFEDLLDDVVTGRIAVAADAFGALVREVVAEVGATLARGAGADSSWESLAERITAGRLALTKEPVIQQSGAAAVQPPSPAPEVRDVAAAGRRGTIRVEVDQLDGMMNLAGELLVNRHRLDRKLQGVNALRLDLGHTHEHLDRLLNAAAPAGGSGGRGPGAGGRDDALGDAAADARELTGQIARELGQFSEEAFQFTRLTQELQDELTRARVVPLAQLFERLAGAVRDAGEVAGRAVDYHTHGGEIGLDRVVADRVFNSLLHLVRNAIAHGFEDPAVRMAAGKPAAGRLTVSGRHEAGCVVLDVADDGAGLDRVAIVRRARERGWVDAERDVSEAEIHRLIFQPGLSTAAQTNSLAGRGVGLDAVREEVARLGGEIAVRSEAGRGTTFVLTLPLTLAINRVLLVHCGRQALVVPVSVVEQVVSVAEANLAEQAGTETVTLDNGDVVPVIRAGVRLRLPVAAGGQGLIVRAGGGRWAVIADRVERKLDVVVKALGPLLGRHPYFSGATIMGDGRVAFVLDVAKLTAAGATAALASSQIGAPLLAPARPGRGPGRVLVVDDSLSLRLLTRRHFEELGCDVMTAADGQEALERLREAPFDLVVTDLEMPRVNGFDLLRAMQAEPAGRGVPAVMMTTRDAPEHRARATALGVADYLIKPVSRRQLAAVCERLLSGRSVSPAIPPQPNPS